jgi:uncharacterized protein
MLIQFSVANYRSIREQQTLTLVASAGKEHLDTHTCLSGLKSPARLLRSAVIYGPNAAGKTNVLKALDFMKSIVIGSVVSLPTAEAPYDPFKLSIETREAPSTFEVSFVQEGVLYEYGFGVTAQRIHEEWLIEYRLRKGREVFHRQFIPKNNSYEWKFSNAFKGNRALWRDSTRENALFLSTAAQLNSVHLLPIFAWFQRRLVFVPSIIGLNAGLTLQLLSAADGKHLLLPFVRKADPGIGDVEIKREAIPGAVPGGMLRTPRDAPFIIDQSAPNSPPEQVSITFSHGSIDDDVAAAIDLFEESAGTQALFMAAGALLNVLRRGEILLFDEIDTSLHPLLTRFIVGLFNSEKNNPNGAQLICSTHDTTLLDVDVFRRDQVWFVEKGEDRASHLFPLSDFSPRKDDSLERAYLRGRYGALPVLDSGLGNEVTSNA